MKMKTQREKRLEKAVKEALKFMSGDDFHTCEMCGGQTVGICDFHPKCACFPLREALKEA